MTTFTIVAAMTPTGLIGNGEHGLPWVYSADLKHFAAVTKAAGAVIMGRNTFDILIKEGIGALPDRHNFVITRDPLPDGYILPPNLQVCYSPEEAIERVAAYKPFGYQLGEVCVIGGKEIFAWFMDRDKVDKMIITEIPSLFAQGTVYFPDFQVMGGDQWSNLQGARAPSGVWINEYPAGTIWYIHSTIITKGLVVHTYGRDEAKLEEE